jgi:hypothetical protein
VRSLPLGDATAIFFSSPAFTMLLSTVLLKDHCGVYRVFIGIVNSTVMSALNIMHGIPLKNNFLLYFDYGKTLFSFSCMSLRKVLQLTL